MSLKRWMAIIAAMILLLTGSATGEGTGLSVTAPGEAVRPGIAAVISFSVPADGKCDLRLLDRDGQELAVIGYNKRVTAGENALYVSALTGQGVQQLKERLGAVGPRSGSRKHRFRNNPVWFHRRERQLQIRRSFHSL